MWFVPDVNLEAAASAEPALPTLAQARIRSAEAQGMYDQAVLTLAQRYDC